MFVKRFAKSVNDYLNTIRIFWYCFLGVYSGQKSEIIIFKIVSLSEDR